MYLFRASLMVFFLPIFFLSCAGIKTLKRDPEPAVRHITVVFSGSTEGHFEPVCCGSRNRGGFARRAYFVNKMRTDCPEVLYFETGGLLKKKHDQDKVQYMSALLNYLKPDALNVAAEDAVVLREESISSPLLSANIRLSSNGNFLFREYLVKTIGRKKIGIFGIAEPSGAFDGFYVDDPVISARNAATKLQSIGCSVIIMLSGLGKDGNFELSEQVSGIDFILSTSDESEDFYVMQTPVVFTSTKGRDLGILALNLEGGKAAFTNIVTQDIIGKKIEESEPGQFEVLKGVDIFDYCKKTGYLFSGSKDSNSYIFTTAALDKTVGHDPTAELIVGKYREMIVKKGNKYYLQSVPTLDLNMLSENQRLKALRLLNQTQCGYNSSSIARSAASDLFCRELGNIIIKAVQSGETEGTISYRILYETALRKFLDNRENVQ